HPSAGRPARGHAARPEQAPAGRGRDSPDRGRRDAFGATTRADSRWSVAGDSPRYRPKEPRLALLIAEVERRQRVELGACHHVGDLHAEVSPPTLMPGPYVTAGIRISLKQLMSRHMLENGGDAGLGVPPSTAWWARVMAEASGSTFFGSASNAGR